MAKLLYQGHASFRIISEDNCVIYVDPYAGDGYVIPADIVLSTHEHPDHNKVSLVTLKENGKVYRSSDFMINGVYKTMTRNNIRIQATPAYNTNHYMNECVGYLITVDGLKIYAAGDTSKTKYMRDVLSKEKVDYALLPIDGVYNMDVKEAAECAKIIGATHTIPIHMKPGKLFDEKKAYAFNAVGKLIIFPGIEIQL